MRYSHIVVKKARLGSGRGLFALRKLNKGEHVADYTGDKIPTKVADTLSTRYLFELDDEWTIDGSMRSNVARYINHACRPNTEAKIENGAIRIYANRSIQAGSEITIDYGDEYFDEFIRPRGCLCETCVPQKQKSRTSDQKARN